MRRGGTSRIVWRFLSIRRRAFLEFQGIGVSAGIIIGKAFRLEKESYDIKPTWIGDHEVEQEVERFLAAISASKDQLLMIRKRVESLADNEHLHIIDAHLMILEDQMLVNETVEYIRRHRLSAEWSLKRVLDKLKEQFERREDPYFK